MAALALRVQLFAGVVVDDGLHLGPQGPNWSLFRKLARRYEGIPKTRPITFFKARNILENPDARMLTTQLRELEAHAMQLARKAAVKRASIMVEPYPRLIFLHRFCTKASKKTTIWPKGT
jgi:hypothetical protein